MREKSSWIQRGLVISLFAALSMSVYACADSDEDNACIHGALKCENNKKIVCEMSAPMVVMYICQISVLFRL